MMRSKRNIWGFTMAELLIVVAIISVLGGVGFIAVQRYNRSMAQLERDAIAKEIFVAAQNHLTMAASQAYPGVAENKFGTKGEAQADTDSEGYGSIYYYVVNSQDQFTAAGNTALDFMLPFGAVDETVRVGGDYIIRYQKDPAVVLDVFYATREGTRYGYDFKGEDDYAKLVDSFRGDDKRNDRRSYTGNSVLGWYGGAAGLETAGEQLQPPVIEIINAERLIVKVKNTNSGYTDEETGAPLSELKLIIKGDSSGAMAAIPLKIGGGSRYDTIVSTEDYSVILDDVTKKDGRFADLNKDNADIDRSGVFLPGENITVSAVAFSNRVLTNIAYSAEVTTNSLFADLTDLNDGADESDDLGFSTEATEESTATEKKVAVANIRHLENLDRDVSDFKYANLDVRRAEQTEHLDWTAFKAAINAETPDGVSVYYADSDTKTEAGCFKPVNLDYTLTYDGKSEAAAGTKDETESGDAAGEEASTVVIHKISNVKVNYAGNAGVFGAVTAGGEISNLEIVDCDIVASGDAGNAGALVGSLKDVKVKNVLAHGKPEFTVTDADGKTSTVTRNVTAGGSAGGLIGVITGGSVERSAAALYVKGGKDAGGLIGTIIGVETTVSHSYSGGHTKNAAYDADKINVTGSENAGGLIGDAGSTTVQNCYSTCSVSGGKTAGGLVGVANTVNNCYATGLVTGEASAEMGAFAGNLRGYATENCRFYEIINGDMSALGPGSGEGIVIKALDESIESYNTFVGAPAAWKDAVPYDETLANVFKVDGKSRYSLQTVSQLDDALKLTYEFAAIHYGDWPAPETFVENKKGTK